MGIRPFEAKDYKELNSWFNYPECMVPGTGYIVPGIAAGFITTTDTLACFFEPFIANPEASKEQRSEALELIMTRLTDKAKELGFMAIYGLTTAPTMRERALAQGFKDIGKFDLVIKVL